MKKSILAVIMILVVWGGDVVAQETYFGKNKVRYKDFDWSYIQTRHFDIHFYEDAYATARFAAAVLESSYVEISTELGYLIQRRVPVFVYNSPNDFQQTNIISSIIPEGVGGFTEAFKNRIVIPFNGSYEDYRHVLHHELTHAVIYDMLYGNMFATLLSRQRLFNLPLWFAEGFAEYSSRHGWDYQSDMYVRDATITGYLTPPDYLGGFLAYKQGQAMVKYIADKYGEDKLGEILRKGKVHLTMGRALKEAIGKTEKEFWEEFSKEMKRRYWPDIATRKDPDEIGKQLTHAREDGSYFNEHPAFAPDGDRIAIYTDKSDYTEIVLISAHSGEVSRRLVKGERSGDLESLHSYVSGLSFSPDGRQIVFVAKSDGKPALMFYDLKSGDIYKKRRTDFYSIVSPAWSPDGKSIALAALKGDRRDIYVYHIDADDFKQITDDRHDDNNPSWLPDSRRLVFTSDRPHPENVVDDGGENIYISSGAHQPGGFAYGFYNLFRVDTDARQVSPLNVGPGQNMYPAVSPDGSKVAFISSRNGIDNMYIAYIDSTGCYAVSDILTGVRSLSWSPDGTKVAFSAFNQGAFDIFVLNDLVPADSNGVLTTTNFVQGKYALLKRDTGAEQASVVKDAGDWLDTTSSAYGPNYENYPVDVTELAGAADSVGTTAADSASTDSTAVDSAATAAETSEKDSVVTETGIYGDDYVYVSKPADDPFGSILVDVPDDSSRGSHVAMTEPPLFDSIPEPAPGGDYEVHKYKVRFTPDYVSGGLSYDTFFGLRGQSFFVFSDYLGNHQIYLATDLVNTIDQSNLQLFYFYNRNRTNYGAGIFHTKNFYLDTDDHLFSDRFYGIQGYLARPFSTFSRVELFASQYFIDRQYYDFDDPRTNRSSKVTTGEVAYVTDNIVWGNTGPINGRRAKLRLSGGVNLFDSGDIEFTSAEFDYRKYWHIHRSFSFAFRATAGASFGRTPKLYFLGGTTNWIGNRTLDARVYEVENLYFADVITPLRGVPYYELSGNRYGLLNVEFRFPLIDYFAMRFPLPLVISRVNGAIFCDMGAAWTDDNFKGGTSVDGKSRLQDIRTGIGFGMRMNLGFFLLRYDLAWSTDFYEISDKPSYYFSFGADF